MYIRVNKNWTHFYLSAQRAELKSWTIERDDKMSLDYARVSRSLYISFSPSIYIVIEKGGAGSGLDFYTKPMSFPVSLVGVTTANYTYCILRTAGVSGKIL